MQFLLLIHYWYRAIVWTCKRYSTAHIIRYTWIHVAIVNIINNCVIYSYWEKNIFFLLSPLYQFVWPFSSKEIKKNIFFIHFNFENYILQFRMYITIDIGNFETSWFKILSMVLSLCKKINSFSRGWFRLLN